MILAEDLERLVGRRASLVNVIVNALLPGYQFFPLLKRGLAFEYMHIAASRCVRRRTICGPLNIWGDCNSPINTAPLRPDSI